MFDIIFISYDEPNADELYGKLDNMIPTKRVHGVTGFDAAHKEAAKISKTKWFYTVDGDNEVLENFISFYEKMNPDHYPGYNVFSWSSKNVINNLVYGNGGIKLWRKDYVLNEMNSHENSKNGIEFCWEKGYGQSNKIFSLTRPNASAFQAFRAGYREGVKMLLHLGEKWENYNLQKINPLNLNRLQIWASIGLDEANGIWSIYGTRLGAKYIIENNDPKNIRDYTWFLNLWTNVKEEFNNINGDDFCTCENFRWKTDKLLLSINNLGTIFEKVNIPVSLFSSEQSVFFKSLYTSPPRTLRTFDG